jgi:hypothetical protein
MLTAKQEQYCQYISLGLSSVEAYQMAYAVSKEAAESHAHRLGDNGGITARIAELRGETSKATVLTAIERREWLSSLVRTPASQIGPDSPLCNGIEYTQDGTPKYKIPCKLTALKLDALLSGDLKEGQTGNTVNILLQS